MPLPAIWRLSFSWHKDSNLISPKCPCESLPRGNNHLADLPVQSGPVLLRGESNNDGSLSLFGHSSLKAHLCVFWRWKQAQQNIMYTRVTSSKLCFQLVCTVIVFWRCGLYWMCWRNSQGDEPFISQASAITEACSHGHNHLLKLVEIRSLKLYWFGVDFSIKDIFCGCHWDQILSVPAESSKDSRFKQGFIILLVITLERAKKRDSFGGMFVWGIQKLEVIKLPDKLYINRLYNTIWILYYDQPSLVFNFSFNSSDTKSYRISQCNSLHFLERNPTIPLWATTWWQCENKKNLAFN